MAIVVALVIAVPSISSATTAPADQKANGEQPSTIQKPCNTVTPKTYNRYVKKLDQITGKRHHKASRKVCKSKWYELKRKIKKARADCLRNANVAVASHYGRGDGFLGGPLACGGRLYAGQIGTAHKTLPCGTILYFKTASGKGLRVPVIDRGPYIGGRTFDLTSWTADRVGTFDGVGQVTYSSRNCWR